MAPTNYEIICWVILAVVALAFLIYGLTRPDDHIEITDRKLKDWEREEKKWR